MRPHESQAGRYELMKITIERGLLLKVLTHVQSVVERRNTIPILSNVKFEAPNGQLSLNAQSVGLFFPQLAALLPPGANVPVAVQLEPQIQPLVRVVGPPDLAFLLKAWGENPGHPADVNGDGVVAPGDLAQLLNDWGPCQ